MVCQNKTIMAIFERIWVMFENVTIWNKTVYLMLFLFKCFRQRINHVGQN